MARLRWAGNVAIMFVVKILCLANRVDIFLLQHPETRCAEAAIIQFANVLYFVNTKRYHAALALRKLIGLALKRLIAPFAADNFVFGSLSGLHCRKGRYWILNGMSKFNGRC